MISPKSFIDTLGRQGITFFTGVPDSLLKSFCACLTDTVDSRHNIIAANEGGAVGLAAGYHLASGQIGLVYMQNSGEGNTINPLASLTDKEVYNIPILLLVGWRGEPGVHDEPQHVKQGKITLSLLDVMNIPYVILSKDEAEASRQVETAVRYMQETLEPYALVVEKDTFQPYTKVTAATEELSLSREQAIQLVASAMGPRDIAVSTTGMISRELFEYRAAKGESHDCDFLTVGSMGHASQIALGIALTKPDRVVWCLDGDGAAIMHMGAMALVGTQKPRNLIHVVFNNGAHDSVGGQPTVGQVINLDQVATAVGYGMASIIKNESELLQNLQTLPSLRPLLEGPCFLDIWVRKGNRADLGRPTTTPIQNKKAFMSFLQGESKHVGTRMFNQEIIYGIDNLPAVVARSGRKKLLLVAGSSFSRLSIRKDVDALPVERVQFSGFTPNPTYDEVLEGLDMFQKEGCDGLLAIGGGSAIDVAKCIKWEVMRASEGKCVIPLIAIPTTAGSGSESTHSAVVYKEGVKHSIGDDRLLPDVCLLEKSVLNTLPKYQKQCTMLDALCQSVESLWSVRSTPVSTIFATEALSLIRMYGSHYLETSGHEGEILTAANLAGHAINITATTAAHAMSYKLTELYGLPHGHAVAVCLPEIWEYMEKNPEKCVDPRGYSHLQDVLKKIVSILAPEGNTDGPTCFRQMLSEMNILNPVSKNREEDLRILCSTVNQDRLKNNPVVLDETAIRQLYEAIVK